MNIKTIKIIDVQEWDSLVISTYEKPYSFQQQDGCRDRGLVEISVPEEFDESDLPHTIPETLDSDEMCVKFSSWLLRNPSTPLHYHLGSLNPMFSTTLWWHRNFYPDVQMIANDLHAKGLLEVGKYYININW